MVSSTKPSLPWRETPLMESIGLSRAAGCKIHLKLENLQSSGSFKSRGVGNYMLERRLEHAEKENHEKSHLVSASGAPLTNGSSTTHRAVHFYSSSGGNAGLAAVHAASALGLPCTVVVPQTTLPKMIEKMRIAGAHDVVQFGASWQEADNYLRQELLNKDPEGVYVPPFDHPDVWAGNAGLIKEVVEQLKGVKPAALVCSVGGGGLFTGLQMGLEKAGWQDVPIIALETKGADCFYQSIHAGKMVTLPAITSQARCLGARRCAETAFKYGQRANVRTALFDDETAAKACIRFANEERILVELACGVNVAACYQEGFLSKVLGRDLAKDEVVVVVLCGGSDVDIDTTQEWKQKFC